MYLTVIILPWLIVLNMVSVAYVLQEGVLHLFYMHSHTDKLTNKLGA